MDTRTRHARFFPSQWHAFTLGRGKDTVRVAYLCLMCTGRGTSHKRTDVPRERKLLRTCKEIKQAPGIDRGTWATEIIVHLVKTMPQCPVSRLPISTVWPQVPSTDCRESPVGSDLQEPPLTFRCLRPALLAQVSEATQQAIRVGDIDVWVWGSDGQLNSRNTPGRGLLVSISARWYSSLPLTASTLQWQVRLVCISPSRWQSLQLSW